MKYGTLLDEITAHALNLTWLREAVAPASPYGARRFAMREPFVPGREADAQSHARSVMRVAAALDAAKLDAARDLARRAPDVAPSLARVSMGDALEDAELLELQRFFDACERLDALTRDAVDVPRTSTPAVRACAAVLERGRSGAFGFYLSDAFDLRLAQERAAHAAALAEYDALRGRRSAAVAAQLRREISGNEFIVMRDELHAPLPPGVRVVREAPTYLLCELDADESVLAALAKRDAAATRVAEAESRVRTALATVVREHLRELDDACDAFAIADLLIGAARFAQRYECSAPSLDANAVFAIEGARFLPLVDELRSEGRSYESIEVKLDGAAVLTGPNMGGKSVCLRTCGLVAVCAAYGLPVPARSARLPLFANVAWLGIGGDDVQGGLLSAFAREVVRLKEVLARSAPPRLVLMDEFARTTNPREGRALVVAIVERLNAEKACALIATHVDGVASAAGVPHYAVRGLRGIPAAVPGGNVRDALVTLAAQMDYRLVEVRRDAPPASDAIALAALLGIDAEIVDAAYRLLREDE